MIIELMVFLEAFPNQSSFKHTQNVFQDVPESPIESVIMIIPRWTPPTMGCHPMLT